MRKQLEDSTCRCIVLYNISNVGCGRHVTFSDSINNGLEVVLSNRLVAISSWSTSWVAFTLFFVSPKTETA